MSALADIGTEVVNALRDSLQRNNVNASGRLSRSIQSDVEVTKDFQELTVSALAYVFAVEEGRAPTRRSQGGILYPQILRWIDEKPVAVPSDFKDTRSSTAKEKFAWAITQKIHRDGTKLFRSGKPSGVLSSVLNETFLDKALAKLGNEAEGEFITQLRGFV